MCLGRLLLRRPGRNFRAREKQNPRLDPSGRAGAIIASAIDLAALLTLPHGLDPG